jgi:predicted nucleic acid-binding protein
MAAYLDTSVLVALFFLEDASAAARARASRENQLWVSRWTLAEFASAVAYKRRSARTDEDTAAQASARLLAAVAQRLRTMLVTADRAQVVGCAVHGIDRDLLVG